MERNNIIESGGFYFIHNFDSGNLGHVERVPTELIAPTINHRTNAAETPDYEFNLWTRPDCAGTEFENGNRTWFYFGIQASEPGVLVRLNLINLNKQGKMYNQGMAPVTRTLPGKPQWERIKDRPVHSTDDNTFTLSFKYRTSENMKATTFFAFTYPFSFAELQIALNSIDLKMLPLAPSPHPDDIYYYRECLVYSLEGRRVDLLTISSHHNITNEREDRLKNLFPENKERPFKFKDKKIIFMSARVHPGETPSSFVFNGFLNLLLSKSDPVAVQLRKSFVFKMIPFLNPDGVARGHYRTDTRGVNLNRVYLNPSLLYHPTVYASRALIRYYHYGCEKEDTFEDSKSFASASIQNISESSEAENTTTKKKKPPISASNKNDRKLNKSTTLIKQASPERNKKIHGLSAEETGLAEQVLDMKIQEPQTSDTSLKPSTTESKNTDSVPLNDKVLRSCLGYEVHVTTSDELNIQGNNPLRPLRDTLKNSISLLMGSSTSDVGSLAGQQSRTSTIKMGWCRDCRAAVERLERTMPEIASLMPSFSSMRYEPHTSSVINSIDEYRDLQKQQYENEERKAQEDAAKSEGNDVYFCTNCFKRFVITDNDEEIKLCSAGSTTSVAVSAGDGGVGTMPSSPSSQQTPDVRSGSIGDSADPPSVSMPQKQEKSKILAKATPKKKSFTPPKSTLKEPDSGLFLYIDLHGHASKKGIFMYGNHFEDLESAVECMLLPRIMSLNNLHFHFSSCNFTERNMYLKDRRDGMSREGSGRVAVLKATGLVRSYTLECNYNTGRLVNVLPPAARDPPAPPQPAPPAPPKYTPHLFEEVGRSLGASILDLTGQHPNSRIPCSEHRNISSVRDWLRAHSRSLKTPLTMSRLRPKPSSPIRAPLYARSKGKVTDERKENTYAGAKDPDRKQTSIFSQRSGHDLITMSMRAAKKSEPVKTPSKTRYLTENEPKPKTLTTKRRNILAIRKPNTSKTQLSGIVKTKVTRRSADDAENPRASMISTKLSKRSFGRTMRGSRTESTRCRAMASSSSDDMIGGNWEDVSGGTALGSQGGSHADAHSAPGKRRPFPAPSPARLKKIRLKTAL